MDKKISKETIKAMKYYSGDLRTKVKELDPRVAEVTHNLKVAQEEYASILGLRDSYIALSKIIDVDIGKQELSA